MTNIVDLPNIADTINKAVGIIHAEFAVMFQYDGPRSDEEKERMRKILEDVIARNPEYKRRSAEDLAELYFDLWNKRLGDEDDGAESD